MSDTPEETAKKRRLLEEIHAIEAEFNAENGKNGSVDDVKTVVQDGCGDCKGNCCERL